MRKESLRMKIAIVSLALMTLTACDPDRKKKCEWYLMPDVDRIGKVDSGNIPLCARNFTNNKQDCRLQAPLEFSKQHYNRKFRYIDMDYEGPKIPRTVKTINHCE